MISRSWRATTASARPRSREPNTRLPPAFLDDDSSKFRLYCRSALVQFADPNVGCHVDSL